MNRTNSESRLSRLRKLEAAELLMEESTLALIETSTDLVLTERLIAHYTNRLMASDSPESIGEIGALLRRAHADRGVLRTDYARTRRNHRTLYGRVAELREGKENRHGGG